MAVKDTRLIFELSEEERNQKLMSVLVKAADEARALNVPMVYRDSLCSNPNMFIHKYPDGKKLLIEQDPYNSSEKILQVLN